MTCKKYVNFRYNQKLAFYFPNFTASEFKCNCKGKYCKGFPAKLDFELLHCIQLVREHFDKPVIVTGGLRCTKYNSSLSNSSKNSAHKTGKAADIRIVGVHPREIHKLWTSFGVGYTYYGTPEMGDSCHVQIGW